MVQFTIKIKKNSKVEALKNFQSIQINNFILAYLT